MLPRERDMFFMAVVGIATIENYLKSEQLVINQEMSKILSSIKDNFEKIEKFYAKDIDFRKNDAQRTKNILKDVDFKLQQKRNKNGVHINFEKDDIQFIVVIEPIVYWFYDVNKLSKHVNTEIKNYIDDLCNQWESWVNYVYKL